MQVEPFTEPENSLLTYLFWKYRMGCYDEIGAAAIEGTDYKKVMSDLRLLSEIERKLEVHLT